VTEGNIFFMSPKCVFFENQGKPKKNLSV